MSPSFGDGYTAATLGTQLFSEFSDADCCLSDSIGLKMHTG